MNKTLSMSAKLIIVFLSLLLSSCGGGVEHSSSSGETVGMTMRLVWEDGGGSLSRAVTTPRSAPSGVVTVSCRVTGSGMNEIVSDFAASAGSGVIPEVPVGTARVLSVQGLDSSQNIIYQGGQSGITLVSGQPYDCGTITMTAVNVSDSSDVDNDGDSYTEIQGDCDDTDSSIYPGAFDTCEDGVDQDCSGSDAVCGADPGGSTDPNDIDDDYDGYTENQGDCSDHNNTIYPGAIEICGDGIAQDCSGGDELCLSDIDHDLDGYTVSQGDCDDFNDTINPGATDIAGDGIDRDCSGYASVISAGQIWLDRNLGASKVATSENDETAYGDLYQWGRGTDGHEKRTSLTTPTNSNTDVPGHGDFIISNTSPFDWRLPQNDNLWQGVFGTNNPCPAGFRMPTHTELETERVSWGSQNSAGAYASPLKHTQPGLRDRKDGSIDQVGSGGYYWSSTANGNTAQYLSFNSGSAYMDNYLGRSVGYSIRCIQDDAFVYDYDGDGFTVSQGDCDDGDSTIHPGATDVPGDGIDQDCSGSDATISFGTVTSVGQVWMDRNLGASQVATNSNDSEAYGDLYQWGRGTDGHEKRDSPSTSTLSLSDTPGHGSFILNAISPYDWRSPQNDTLWQGVSSPNNPCPAGFRLPTETEFETERVSWNSNNSAGAFTSPLKLVWAGDRGRLDGTIRNAGIVGHYWSSSVYGSDARDLSFSSSLADRVSYNRSYGFSVRCIQD
ncbi:MAG: hypothetical protein KJ950_13435 [Proteobacteria bacterium]|nr:hypothetical protein [Pseudomonadota bacterium]MBU1687444.1 hypothetical protein [Pseudomonadota bacterium]